MKKNLTELRKKPAKEQQAIESPSASLLSEKTKNKWQAVCNEYGYLGFAFGIPIVLMFLLYVAMELYPFGNGSVLVLDLNAQYAFFYEALREWVWGDAS